mgnify:CR=1 FL=1
MGIINKDMRDVVSRSMLSFVATVCPDGSPNLSPKSSLRVFDDNTIVFMDIASPQTVANLRFDPRIEINSIDFIRRRGYRFKGKAHIEQPGSTIFEWLNDWLIKINGPGYPANRAIVVNVERALPVLSPAYSWGNITEEELTLAWAERYLEVEGLSTDNLRMY